MVYLTDPLMIDIQCCCQSVPSADLKILIFGNVQVLLTGDTLWGSISVPRGRNVTRGEGHKEQVGLREPSVWWLLTPTSPAMPLGFLVPATFS